MNNPQKFYIPESATTGFLHAFKMSTISILKTKLVNFNIYACFSTKELRSYEKSQKTPNYEKD